MQSVTIKDILNEILKKTELCLVDGIEVKTTEVYRKLIEATKGINPVNKRGLDDEIVMFDKAIEMFAYEVLRFDQYSIVHSSTIADTIESAFQYLSLEEYINICSYYGVLDRSFKQDPSTPKYMVNDDERIDVYRIETILKGFLLSVLDAQIYKIQLYLTITAKDSFWYSLYMDDLDENEIDQHDEEYLENIKGYVDEIFIV